MVRAQFRIGHKIEEVRKRLGADYQHGQRAPAEIQELRMLERNAKMIWDLPDNFRSFWIFIGFRDGHYLATATNEVREHFGEDWHQM